MIAKILTLLIGSFLDLTSLKMYLRLNHHFFKVVILEICQIKVPFLVISLLFMKFCTQFNNGEKNEDEIKRRERDKKKRTTSD